jgi:hypothetical protein
VIQRITHPGRHRAEAFTAGEYRLRWADHPVRIHARIPDGDVAIGESFELAGMTGCDRFKVAGVTDVCFIVAYDANTGKELWKTSTVARPGEPGDASWGDVPLIFRAGSATRCVRL